MADRVIVRDARLDYYPPGWARWSQMVRERHRPKDLGLEGNFADLNRFAHRYRVARSFRGVILDQYTQDTTDGYSGLFAVFLTWSAFEQYLKIAGWKQAQAGQQLARYNVAAKIDQLRGVDPEMRFFKMIAGKSNPEVSRQLTAFMAGEGFNFTYLASSIRHVFAHGFLTPNANKSRPQDVAEITTQVARLHLDILGREFKRRVAAATTFAPGT